MRTVVDARIADLLTHLDEFPDSTIVHRYASWSLEQLRAAQGERHLACWPLPAPIDVKPFTIGTPAGDYVTTRYAILVWEDASTEVTSLTDNEAADGAWLDLAEAIEARLRVQANVAMGEAGSLTRVDGRTWGLQAQTRWLQIVFAVGVPVALT